MVVAGFVAPYLLDTTTRFAEAAASLPDLLAKLRPVDVVLVEGFKQLEGLRRVEVFRGEGAPLALADPGIAAVAVPGGVPPAGYRGLTLSLEDTPALLKFILSA